MQYPSLYSTLYSDYTNCTQTSCDASCDQTGHFTRTCSDKNNCGYGDVVSIYPCNGPACPTCTPANCGKIAGCNQYENPEICGDPSGYQKCITGTCSDGTTQWTQYCNPDCSSPTATCYRTPSCTTNVNCNDNPGICTSGPGSCPPSSYAGIPECGVGGNCYTDCRGAPTPQHLECQNNACMLVPGSGPNTCTVNGDCQQSSSNTHLSCQGTSCVTVAGAGSNTCVSNNECLPPPTATPTPTPIAPTPTIGVNLIPPSVLANCTTADVGYTGAGVTISWAPTTPAVIYVDISNNIDFISDPFNSKYFYNKQILSGTSTTAPNGFTGLTLYPITYYVRLYNGYTHSDTKSFTLTLCPAGPNPKPWMQVFGDVHTNK